MSDSISTDDWRAEIDRLSAQGAVTRAWVEEELKIVEYGYGKVTRRELLAVLNEANKKAGRPPRPLGGLIHAAERLGLQKAGWDKQRRR